MTANYRVTLDKTNGNGYDGIVFGTGLSLPYTSIILGTKVKKLTTGRDIKRSAPRLRFHGLLDELRILPEGLTSIEVELAPTDNPEVGRLTIIKEDKIMLCRKCGKFPKRLNDSSNWCASCRLDANAIRSMLAKQFFANNRPDLASIVQGNSKGTSQQYIEIKAAKESLTRRNEGILIPGPRVPRQFQQSAIERADTDDALFTAITDRVNRESITKQYKPRQRQEQPTWYLTLTGYDISGNAALKTGFTGYQDSTRPEAATTYNPRATQKLKVIPNICKEDTRVWEEALRNIMRRDLGQHAQLDHEVFYTAKELQQQVVDAFTNAAKRVELIYASHRG